MVLHRSSTEWNQCRQLHQGHHHALKASRIGEASRVLAGEAAVLRRSWDAWNECKAQVMWSRRSLTCRRVCGMSARHNGHLLPELCTPPTSLRESVVTGRLIKQLRQRLWPHGSPT